MSKKSHKAARAKRANPAPTPPAFTPPDRAASDRVKLARLGLPVKSAFTEAEEREARRLMDESSAARRSSDERDSEDPLCVCGERKAAHYGGTGGSDAGCVGFQRRA